MVRRFVASENENDRVVCANVFGLRWSTKLLALMECAARSSYLVMQPWKAFPVYRFRERRVRPLCHLIAVLIVAYPLHPIDNGTLALRSAYNHAHNFVGFRGGTE